MYDWQEEAWIPLIGAASHVVGSLPDIESDKKAGLKTIGTIFGWRSTVILAQTLAVLAILLEDWSLLTTYFGLIELLLSLVLLIKPNEKTWDKLAKTTVFLGIIYALTWIYMRSIT